MVASAARLQANRLNALKSTGPRTAEGKERSRANALKHGLTAVVCRTPLDDLAAEDWARRCPEAATSTALDAEWLAQEVAVITDRIARIGKMEVRNRERAALRAATSWDEDREREAESLGAHLSRHPSEILGLLQETPQGCSWLIARWAMLARVADLEAGWDEPAQSLAFDLLGVPHEVRKGRPGHEIGNDGRVIDEALDPVAVARAQVDRLQALRDEVAHLDDFDRDSALIGLDMGSGVADRRLRNYELALHRRLRWYLEKLGEGQPPRLAVEPDPTTSEASEPIESAGPCVDPAPIVEAPAPASPRRERKAHKVELRRAAAERKRARRVSDDSSRTTGSA